MAARLVRLAVLAASHAQLSFVAPPSDLHVVLVTNRPASAPPTRTARRLHDDHVDFVARFADIEERARSGDWQELDEVWSRFAADVEAHLVFEEREALPILARQGLHERALVRHLQADHAAIRHLLDEIGAQIQLHVIRAATIEVFLELMRDHAAVEDERLYPWLAGRASAAAAQRAAS
jgi:hypothetical protein